MSRYDYEYEWDIFYCYPNSHVLKNKLNIFNSETLATAEREITAARIAEIMDKPVRGNFDFNHLQAIHHAIFRDIFEWAGVPRTVDISKGNQFCLYRHLNTYAGGIFDTLNKEEFLRCVTANDMPERLAYYMSEINVLHPFRDGNGRIQRIFIEYLAQCAGFDVDFSSVSGGEMIEACALSFAKEYTLMIKMFKRITTTISPEEQSVYRNQILK